jgi:hypothetical protein
MELRVASLDVPLETISANITTELNPYMTMKHEIGFRLLKAKSDPFRDKSGNL